MFADKKLRVNIVIFSIAMATVHAKKIYFRPAMSFAIVTFQNYATAPLHYRHVSIASQSFKSDSSFIFEFYRHKSVKNR